MPPKLGIIAGQGLLPKRLAEAARSAGREVFIIALMGHAETDWPETSPHLWAKLGAAASIIDRLKAEGVKDLVLAGGVKRPTLSDLMPDWRSAQFFMKVGLASLGDDGLLRQVKLELEKEGFHVIGPQDIYADLLAPEGILGQHQPDEVAEADINRGIAILEALSEVDVGQAVVVQQGLILAIEAIEGTAKMLAHAGEQRRGGAGGVLVKLTKAGQHDKLDLPTIGPETIVQAAAAGLSGIAIEAEKTIILERGQTIAAANNAGLFILALRLNKTP